MLEVVGSTQLLMECVNRADDALQEARRRVADITRIATDSLSMVDESFAEEARLRLDGLEAEITPAADNDEDEDELRSHPLGDSREDDSEESDGGDVEEGAVNSADGVPSEDEQGEAQGDEGGEKEEDSPVDFWEGNVRKKKKGKKRGDKGKGNK